MPGRRSRAITLPPVPRSTLQWHAPLFTAEDVPRIGDQAKVENRRFVVAGGVDPRAIAGALNQAFHDAVVSTLMLDRLWQQDPAWFKRLDRDVRRLLATLGLTAEQCTAMAVPLPSDEASPGHCQVNRIQNELAVMTCQHAGLSHLLDARLLSPNPKSLRPRTAITTSAEPMTPRPEVSIDDRVRRQEVLRLSG
jgi:hypothetical protein